MRHLVILAAVVALAAAGPRERRQASTSGYTKCRGGNAECVPYYLCRNDKIITDGSGIIDIRQSGRTKRSSGNADCIPYYLCRNDKIITDGGGIIDIRFRPECPKFLDTCCSLPDVVSHELPIEVRNTTESYVTVPTPTKCGVRQGKAHDIRNEELTGNKTQPGEFPWMSLVLKDEKLSKYIYLCGGSLIHPSIVLTAAHCVDKDPPDSLLVRLGEWDVNVFSDQNARQNREVQKVLIHPQFKPGEMINDFALLYLKNPAHMTETVGIICLDKNATVQPGQYCIVTGWGKDRFGDQGLYQSALKKTDLPFVPHKECESALQTTRLGPRFRLHSTFLCAGGERDRDACTGDGGSPLVCMDPFSDQYVQIGIVAWGIGCGLPKIPGAYADVRQGYEWIVSEADKLAAHPRVEEIWERD